VDKVSEPKQVQPAVAARRRLLVAAMCTITADYADQAGITDEDHPREHNDLRDLAFIAREYVRAVDSLPPARQPRGWSS
jgi:hypothetical protein